tara:strand:- start:294 stop:602 length:309 start_codon:yes stop_codon:yes gene_type:complete
MAFKMKGMSFGNSPIKNYKTPMNSPVKQGVPVPNSKWEGAETMGSEQLREKWGIEGLSSSTDYYIKRGKKGEPMILGEVDLEGGKVTGVPGRKGGKLTREND